ncbi:MAG: ABC transporter permease, partial [Fibrobacter sp.]|nr:ABC transporter permease [Fibrobacter sp.]
TIENERIKFVMQLNPITSIIETFKFGMLGVGSFSWAALAYSVGFMALLLTLGIIVFNRIQRTFMDTV